MNELNAWMGKNEMSGYELARRLGYSESSVSLYRNGIRAVSAEFRLAFLKEFGGDAYREAFPVDAITKFLEKSG